MSSSDTKACMTVLDTTDKGCIITSPTMREMRITTTIGARGLVKGCETKISGRWPQASRNQQTVPTQPLTMRGPSKPKTREAKLTARAMMGLRTTTERPAPQAAQKPFPARAICMYALSVMNRTQRSKHAATAVLAANKARETGLFPPARLLAHAHRKVIVLQMATTKDPRNKEPICLMPPPAARRKSLQSQNVLPCGSILCPLEPTGLKYHTAAA
mmetsp:Transcript_51149/g.136573  ORF Transcript_51149/g.136573 Transcript_51149/m.136573 type:complete len:216 (-) Transcript_51149:1148-1795(-)